MKTLKITIPEGFQVNDLNKETGEITFSPIPKSIKDRIKTFDDVLKENGITRKEFEKTCKDLPPHKIASNMIEEITKAVNEDWVADWYNHSQYKYIPYFICFASGGFSYGEYDSWSSGSSVGVRLCYKSSDLATHFGKLFTDIYKDFLTA